MKHTSGPWKFGKELSCRAGEWLISFDAGNKGRGVAIAETRVGSGSETANARLIAAAPDLLEACYAVLHDCDDIDMVESNEPGRDKGPWQMLNEAIAKATGG